MDTVTSEERFRADLTEADANKTREEQIVEVLCHVGNVVDTADMFPDEEERGEATRHITAYLAQLEDDTPQIPGEAPKLPWKYRELLSYIRRNDMKNFKAVVKRLYEESLKDVNRERYEQWKAQFLNGYLPENDNAPDPNLHTQAGFHAPEAALVTRDRVVQVANISTKWLLRQVYKIPEYIRPVDATSALDELLASLGSNWGQFFSTLAVSLGSAGVIAIYNLWCAKTGRKTIQRAKKDFIDNSAALVVGNLAGYGCQLALSLIFGPLGFWLGLGVQVVVGFVVGGLTRYKVSNWTSSYYKIPQVEDLEKAYKTIGLTKAATNSELNKKCRELCRPLHPDNLHRSADNLADEQIEAAVQKFIEIQNAYKFIKTMREADEAGKDVRENRTWQESFMLFVKNFFAIRRREFSNEESFMKEIGFEVLGFPPSDVYEEPTTQRSNVDIDAPLPTIGITTGTDYHSVANRWWAQFWAMVGNQ